MSANSAVTMEVDGDPTPVSLAPSSSAVPKYKLRLIASNTAEAEQSQKTDTTSSNSVKHFRSASMIMSAVVARLGLLQSDDGWEPSSDQVNVLVQFLSDLVRDGGPLPQAGLADQDAIEVQWLVGGNLASLIVSTNGEWDFWIEEADGSILVDETGDMHEQLPVRSRAAVEKKLSEMGLQAKLWLPI